jgi:hypothetical protein
MMTISEILKELEPYTGRFPMKAMEAAIEQREAITPELLRVLEAVAEDPLAFARRQDYMLHLFALFLLAQFREKRAYAPVARPSSAVGTAVGLICRDLHILNPCFLHYIFDGTILIWEVQAQAL